MTGRFIIEPAGLVITRHDYLHHAGRRTLADAIMVRYGYSVAEVVEARVTEAAIEVDVIERGPGPFKIRTDRHELNP